MERGPTPTFEDALNQLERIVNDLESGTPELATALAKYEQGVRLLAHCQILLDSAEQTISLLTGVDDAGNPLTVPFDATATASREPSPSPTRTRVKLPPKPAPDGDDDSVPF